LPARILARRARAWELAVGGRTQREIAAELGVSQTAVSKMLRRAGTHAWQQLVTHTREQVARECSQLDHVCRESFDAWEKSKVDQTRRRHQRVVHGGAAEEGTGAVATTVAEAVAMTREGDPRFLAIALQALREKRELLTLVGAPALSTPNASDDGWPVEVRRLLQSLSDEELVVMRGVACKRLVLGSAAADPEGGDRTLQMAIDEERAARQRRDGRPTAAGTPTSPACVPDLGDVPPKESDTSDDGPEVHRR
jgi:predicted transcriptional regulator